MANIEYNWSSNAVNDDRTQPGGKNYRGTGQKPEATW